MNLAKKQLNILLIVFVYVGVIFTSWYFMGVANASQPEKSNQYEVVYKAEIIKQENKQTTVGINSDNGYFLMTFFDAPTITPSDGFLVRCRLTGCYIELLTLPPIPTLPPHFTPIPHPTFQPTATPTS